MDGICIVHIGRKIYLHKLFPTNLYNWPLRQGLQKLMSAQSGEVIQRDETSSVYTKSRRGLQQTGINALLAGVATHIKCFLLCEAVWMKPS